LDGEGSAGTPLPQFIFNFEAKWSEPLLSSQVIAMMQTAELGIAIILPIHTGLAHCRTTSGRSFRQRKMRPILV